jgi:hypothetical protein
MMCLSFDQEDALLPPGNEDERLAQRLLLRWLAVGARETRALTGRAMEQMPIDNDSRHSRLAPEARQTQRRERILQ